MLGRVCHPATLLRTPGHSGKWAKLDEKPADWLVASQTRSLSLQGEQKRNCIKLDERRTNVYENKGPVRKAPPQSENVYENKGT